MRTTDLTELLSAVEHIRSTMHPDLSASFVQAVVEAEASHAEDEAAALDAIRVAIKEDLDSEDEGSG